MNCTRLCGVLLTSLAFSTSAAADVTLKQKSGGQGVVAATVGGEVTQYVKGLKIRSDQPINGNQTTTIIDAQARQMIVINHAKKEVEVHDMTKMTEGLSKVPLSDIKTSITPTGQTRQIAGSSCAVYDVKITAPMQIGAETINLVMGGAHCLVKNGPGQADYAAFYRQIAENGLFVGDPSQAKVMPAQVRAMTELSRKMADLGVPYATEMSIKMEGNSPMAAMMSKMGSTSFTTEVTSVSTAPIADAMFDVPAGYKVIKR